MNKVYWLLVFCVIRLTLEGQSSYFPEKASWEKISNVESVGFNPDLLDSVVTFAESHEYSGSVDLKQAILKGFEREPFHEILGPTKDRGHSNGMILYKGKILKQWGDTKRVDMTFSVTKSYLSTIAGLAVDDDLIGLNDQVKDYVWDGKFDGAHNSKITWDHLLTQSSDWTGELFGGKDWADRPPREGGLDDWKFRKLNEPGTVFEYNDVRVNLLAYSLLQVIRKPLPAVLRDRIMDPIGASTTWRWYGYDHSWVNVDGLQIQSVSGGGHSGGGLFISTEDHARFGLLIANNGNWQGKQLLSPEWIEKARQPSLAESAYGYMWWLNTPGSSRFMDGVGESVFYASGFGGNFIVIDQSNDLVIVVRWLEPRYLKDFLNKIYESKQ